MYKFYVVELQYFFLSLYDVPHGRQLNPGVQFFEMSFLMGFNLNVCKVHFITICLFLLSLPIQNLVKHTILHDVGLYYCRYRLY